jgi:hypothetical protein
MAGASLGPIHELRAAVYSSARTMKPEFAQQIAPGECRQLWDMFTVPRPDRLGSGAALPK